MYGALWRVSEGTRTPDRLDHNQLVRRPLIAGRGMGTCSSGFWRAVGFTQDNASWMPASLRLAGKSPSLRFGDRP